MDFEETNYMLYIKNFLGGSDELKEILSKNPKNGQNLISNPIVRSLIIIYRPEPNIPNHVSPKMLTDAAYAKVVGHLLNYLKKELDANQVYKDEVRRKISNTKFGVFSTVFGELFVGGYLKFLGFNVKFNSSKERGKPDVEADNKNYTLANEVKGFPDGESWLEDTIATLMPKLVELLKNRSDVNLFTFVTKIEGFRKGVVKTIKQVLETGQGGKTDTCWVVDLKKAPFSYAGNEGILISNPERDVHLRFKVSFDSGQVTDDLFQKAVTQLKNSKTQGVTWMFFPHPKDISFERKLVWYASGVPTKMKAKGIGVVLFDIVPVFDDTKKELGIKSGINFSVDEKHSDILNKATFNNFIEFLITQPTLIA
jgi:hypothetical protein